MENQPYILLLGESVIMDSVAKSLLEMNLLNVIRISSNSQEIRKFMQSFKPDLIVYEFNEQNANPLFSIINEQPDTFHLAIDLSSKQFTFLHCQRKPTRSMQEFCELIYQEVDLKNNINKEVH
ncbi:MAG: hypothetical protein KAH12_04755 [Anaerolineales bacterium]|nr:hypothetical protein [Anaerolineales bacterium]